MAQYDKALFTFDVDNYDREQVENFSREECEKLCSNIDVVKYDLECYSLQDLFNDQHFDGICNSWVRAFLSEEDDK